jgi:hypothetical protein
MYACALDELPISPNRMRFQKVWIYQLTSFHPFWIEKIKHKHCNEVFIAPSIWESLLQIYNLNHFSPIARAQAFAEDYHRHFNPEISRSQIEVLFQRLHHLGLKKVGHLLKIPISQIQNRFGKKWAIFFSGLLYPDKQNWPWETLRDEKIFKKKVYLDFPVYDCQIFSNHLTQAIDDWTRELSNTHVQRLQVKWPGQSHDDDQMLDIEFPKKISLRKDFLWIKRIIQERLLSIKSLTSFSQFEIWIYTSPPTPFIQLSFFEDRASPERFEKTFQKLSQIGGELFQPEKSQSPQPEKSWRTQKPEWKFTWSSEPLFRPLIQFDPRPIPAPQGIIHPTETLEYFDENKKIQRRHYFIMRSERRWVWIFKNSRHQWFEQGILE